MHFLSQGRIGDEGEGDCDSFVHYPSCAQYKPILTNLKLPYEERLKACDEWSQPCSYLSLYPRSGPREQLLLRLCRWRQKHELLIEYGLTR